MCPKIRSLLTAIEELDATLTVVTETWLADGQGLEDDKQDLFLGAGISMMCKNRNRNDRGLVHGGVAVLYNEQICNFSRIDFKNEEDFEILAAAGKMPGLQRKIIVVACYIPPGYNVPRANRCLETISGIVIEAKRSYKDPYIIVTGDFNQWDLETALEEFRDLVECSAGPTRGNRVIDRTFTNLENITEKAVLQPLQTDEDNGPIRHSDHGLFYLTSRLDRRAKYKWLKYSYRYNNEESRKKFGAWITFKDWRNVLEADGSDNKAEIFQKELLWAVEEFFPLITMKRRDTDPPWINAAVKKLIRGRKRIYKNNDNKKNEEWKILKKRTDDLIERRKKKYLESQKLKLLADDADRNFFRNAKNYMSKQRPKPFDVRDLFPGCSEKETAEKLADHFNSISCEFDPLDQSNDIPATYSRELPTLEVHEVALRLKKIKKTQISCPWGHFPGAGYSIR